MTDDHAMYICTRTHIAMCYIALMPSANKMFATFVQISFDHIRIEQHVCGCGSHLCHSSVCVCAFWALVNCASLHLSNEIARVHK